MNEQLNKMKGILEAQVKKELRNAEARGDSAIWPSATAKLDNADDRLIWQTLSAKLENPVICSPAAAKLEDSVML